MLGRRKRPSNAIERLVEPAFSDDEAHALLWAVRQVPLEALRDGPWQGQYDKAVGYGALSSATNRLESSLNTAWYRRKTGKGPRR